MPISHIIKLPTAPTLLHTLHKQPEISFSVKQQLLLQDFVFDFHCSRQLKKKLFPSTQTPRGDQLAQDNAAGHNFNFLTNHTTFPLQNAIVFHQGKINKRFKTSRGNKVGYFEPDISASCLPLVPTSKLIQ